MKHPASAALLLTVFLFAARLPAQVPGAASQPTIKFSVTSFKRCDAISGNRNTEDPPDGDFIARHCQSIHALVDFAFADMGTHQLRNAPDWVDADGYEFLAKVAPEDVPEWHKTSLGTKRLMLRMVLEDALNLKMHIELQPRPIYALVVAKDGPKLTEHKPGPGDPPSTPNTLVHAGVEWVGPDDAAFTNASMGDLVSSLSARLDRIVADQTGLTARYDFHVQPLPAEHYSAKSGGVGETDFAGIIDGVKTLGLKLEPAKTDTFVIVIDHIDRPAGS